MQDRSMVKSQLHYLPLSVVILQMYIHVSFYYKERLHIEELAQAKFGVGCLYKALYTATLYSPCFSFLRTDNYEIKFSCTVFIRKIL